MLVSNFIAPSLPGGLPVASLAGPAVAAARPAGAGIALIRPRPYSAPLSRRVGPFPSYPLVGPVGLAGIAMETRTFPVEIAGGRPWSAAGILVGKDTGELAGPVVAVAAAGVVAETVRAAE
jgi:hypothetical protein